MKKLILILGPLLLCSAGALAQTKGFNCTMRYQESLSFKGIDDMSANEFIVGLGYNFNSRLYARLNVDVVTGLFNYDGDRYYEKSGAIGVSAGYNIVRTGNYGVIDTSLGIGNNIKRDNWSYIYYDWGARWSVGFPDSLKMALGLGVKYYDSHNSHFKNFCALTVSFGLVFN